MTWTKLTLCLDVMLFTGSWNLQHEPKKFLAAKPGRDWNELSDFQNSSIIPQ